MEKSTSTIVNTINTVTRKPRTTPTLRQKALYKKITDNTEKGGLTMKEAMLEVGYSINTAETPSKITKTKSWIELMDEYLPDQLLQQKHQEGLDATKQEDKEQVPDYAVRKQYLDLAYKIKGKNIDTPTQNINLNVVSDEQIKRLLD